MKQDLHRTLSCILRLPLLEELRFWYTNIDCFNSYRLRSVPSSCTVLFGDASHIGFGGYTATLNGSTVSGMWTDDDINKNKYILKHRKVKLFTDDQAAATIVSIGSSCLELQNIALQIFEVCLKNNIELRAKWIPREYHHCADLLSRFIDKDDWAVNSNIFRLLVVRWKPHTID